MTPLAHSGHWVVNLLYILPLVIALSVLGWQKLSDKRPDPGRAARDASAARAIREDPDEER